MEGLVAHLEQKHFENAWHLRHYCYDAFKRKVRKILDEPHLPKSTSPLIFEMKQGTGEILADCMTRVKFL